MQVAFERISCSEHRGIVVFGCSITLFLTALQYWGSTDQTDDVFAKPCLYCSYFWFFLKRAMFTLYDVCTYIYLLNTNVLSPQYYQYITFNIAALRTI